MADCVIDATVLAFTNSEISARKPNNVFDRRIKVIEQVASGTKRVRYNKKLLYEYKELVKVFRNDLIELFFFILDSNLSVRVSRNSLSRQQYARATNECGWPSHDQHLLAAAIGGDNPSVFVTELRLARCDRHILRCFDIHIQLLC